MKKKLISSILAGVMILSSLCVGVYAYDKYVAKADFKINFNNNPVNLTKEMVTIDGSTYLPLRALCEEVLGLTVDWNGDTQTIDLWNITKPNDRGTHEYPVAKGIGVVGSFKAKKDGYVTYEIAVKDIQRGTSVETELRNYWMQQNPFNPPESNVGSRNDYDSSKKYNEALAKYQEKLAKAEQDYADKLNKYIAKMLGIEENMVTGLTTGSSLTSKSDYEFMKVKVRMDIKPSGLEYEYKTAVDDFTPYCGDTMVNGLQRKYVEYKAIKPVVPTETSYEGKTILTDGVTEGYMYFAVYKNDSTPRVMYKGGQYLALY